jgi:hypothetical protein
MNDIIKKLEKQATNTIINQSSTYGVEVVYNFDKEKFAELIIQECIDWIDGSPTTEEDTLILSKQFILANLKQHFGVE